MVLTRQIFMFASRVYMPRDHPHTAISANSCRRETRARRDGGTMRYEQETSREIPMVTMHITEGTELFRA